MGRSTSAARRRARSIVLRQVRHKRNRGSRHRLLVAAVDGIALLADGAVYVNTFFSGELFRIPVNADGSAGALVKIETSMPLTRPDGLRTVGPQTLLQAEGGGRVAELTIKGDRAEVRVLQEALKSATGVTMVGDTAFVLVERARAVAVPYRSK